MPSPAPGTLRVDWAPWALVTVDGNDAGKTPISKTLDAGEHQITVDVSQRGGRFTAAATVAPGKLTKCRPAGGKLACEPPR